MASRLSTRLALSSPVAAITTSKVCSSSASSRLISQASPSRHCASGTASGSM
ncbi:Uncharacterised protein [Mycobacteroides abscessus subsp. abscessus]|nr:Uncharacterised protein [Mycobacteroides abscessus subsp. abscessus]